MPKAKIAKITNAANLDREIARLKKRTRKLELDLGERVDFFKDNYKSMAINSVIPGAGKHKGVLNIASRIAGIAWSSGNFKSFATSALMTAVEFIGVRFGINLFSKYQQNRRKKRARKKAEKRAARQHAATPDLEEE
ncbi:MAG TPA: hypothetical protein VFS25_17815 [Chitinophaga sp.]|uniref:hypothetical protein n=1 Tax=Chitinophaga sp. TaxID=1869181 RepID=UPI002DB6B947|nr:hypothetical protein [Chitinophaga sp.]HEU4554709.1 hypothetical protein [Chitinophaga sp.]